MKTNRLIAAAMAAALTITAMPVNAVNLTKETITASAEDDNYYIGEVTIDGLCYSIGSKYVTLLDGYEASGEVVIPEMIDTAIDGVQYNIPEKLPVTEISYRAFAGNTKITKVVIPSTVSVLEEKTFENCISLKEAVIPEGVKAIGSRLFAGCTSLEKVSIDKSITDIGAYILEDTAAEEEFYNGKDAMVINGTVVEVKNQPIVRIPDGAVRIAPRLTREWFDTVKIVTLVIPEGVEYIGEDAFDFCVHLEQVFLPSTLKTIAAGAFECTDKYSGPDCCAYYAGTEEEWSNVVLEEDFYNENVFPEKFVYNQSYPLLENADIFSGTKNSVGFAVTKCSSEAEGDITVEVPDADVIEIADKAFSGCDKITSVTIPRTVASIGSTAFTGCTALTDIYYKGTERDWKNMPGEITIPDGVTLHWVEGEMTDPFIQPDEDGVIHDNGCRGDIYFGSEIKKVEWDYDFFGNDKITSLTFAEGLESLMDAAFYDGRNLKEVHLPAGVESIHAQAFGNCPSLTDIWYEGSADDWNKLYERPLLSEKTTLHCKDAETGEYYTCRSISFAVADINGWSLKGYKCRLIHNTPEPVVVCEWETGNEPASFVVPMDTKDGEYSFEHNAASRCIVYSGDDNTVSFADGELNCNVKCYVGDYDIIPLDVSYGDDGMMRFVHGQTKVFSIPAGSVMEARGSGRVSCRLLGSDSEKAVYAVIADSYGGGYLYISRDGTDYAVIVIRIDSSTGAGWQWGRVEDVGSRRLSVGDSTTMSVLGEGYEPVFRINGDEGVRTFDDAEEYLSLEVIRTEKIKTGNPCNMYNILTEYKVTAKKPCNAEIAFRLPEDNCTELSNSYICITGAGEAPAVTGKMGDANSDGKVTVADAVKVLQFIANKGKYSMTETEQELADVDGSRGITGGDAAVIQKVDAGILTLD